MEKMRLWSKNTPQGHTPCAERGNRHVRTGKYSKIKHVNTQNKSKNLQLVKKKEKCNAFFNDSNDKLEKSITRSIEISGDNLFYKKYLWRKDIWGGA